MGPPSGRGNSIVTRGLGTSKDWPELALLETVCRITLLAQNSGRAKLRARLESRDEERRLRFVRHCKDTTSSASFLSNLNPSRTRFLGSLRGC